MALTRAQIQTAFQNSLGRAASTSDENSYFSVSQSGALTDAQIFSTISNSREADQIADPVIRFYQAAFGRVPDQAGLANAESFVRSFGVSAATYQNLSNMFVQSQEFTNRFGTGTAVDAAFVQSLYSTILSRTATSGEVDAFTSGANGYTTRGGVLYAISQSNEAISISDNAVNGFQSNAAQGQAVYSGTLYTAANGQPNTPGTGGTSVSLTTGIDTLTGGGGNDIFTGTVAATGSTLNLGDSVNGGAGNDTLRIISNQAAIPSPVTTSVETYEITSTLGSSLDINAQSTGLTTVNFVGGNDTAFALTNVAATTAFGITNNASQITVTANNVAGTTDAVSLALSGALATSSFTENGIETFNVSSNGNASTLAALASNTLKTVNVSGSAALKITAALADTVTTFNAGGTSGGVNVTLGNADVTVTGGTGNDRFAFAGNLNANDTVVGGAGTDTVAITGVDLTAAANVAQLNALNTKVSGVEVLEFNGATGAVIQGGTGTGAFTNTEITKLVFNTADTVVADTVNQAGSTRTYAFAELNTGDAAINLTAGATSVNLSLEAIADTATPSNTGADVGTLAVALDAGAVAGSTATVNLASIGPGTVANTITSLNAVAGSTFNITGSHELTVSALGAGGTVNASAFTGKLTLTGSGVNDAITTGTGGSTITAGAGVDTINFSASTAVRDIHNITGINAAADRDIVTGFTAGSASTADQIQFATASTTHTGTGVAAIQSITAAPTGAVTFNTTDNDVLALNFNITSTAANANLGAAGVTDGTNLLNAIGQGLSVSADANTGYIVAYQNSNAYLYRVADAVAPGDAGATIQANEINLVGVYNNVAVGGLVAGNFNITA